MANIWFTSDLHLGHNKPFIYEPRGFHSVEDMNYVIINNINTLVKEYDVLYILGDVMLGDNKEGIELLKKIKCQNIKIVLGNHDTDARVALYKTLPNVTVLGYAAMLKVGKYHFYLSHYPTITTNFNEKIMTQAPLCLCGHTHTTKYESDIKNGCYHIELDAHNRLPVNINAIIEHIKILKETGYEN